MTADTDPPRIWRAGERVQITRGGRTLEGTVALASQNGRSLMLSYDGLLSGHLGAMPLLWDDTGAFRSIMDQGAVELAEAQQGER